MQAQFLIMLLFLICFFQSHAQEREIKLKIKFGLNYSTISENNESDLYSTKNSYVPGFHFGIYSEFHTEHTFQIETSLKYSSIGGETEVEGIINGKQSKYTVDTELEYVELNACIIKSYGEFIPGFYTLAGLYASVGVAGKIEFEGYQAQKRIFSSREINWGDDTTEDDFRKGDFGIKAGIGVKIKRVIAEVRYQHGLINISPYTENNYSNKNRVFSFSLGYQFL